MEVPVARLAAAIEEQVRAQATTSPAPRGLPYLALEHPSGTGLHLLDALAARGIFRKYEHVLVLGAGLGGGARCLAARLGCTAVGTCAGWDEARAAADLTRRAGLGARARFLPATPAALPFRDGRFTHVWALEALARVPDLDAVLAEAFRALRPGGHLAVQELVLRDGPAPAALPRWPAADVSSYAAALAHAGFAEIETRDVTADASERSTRLTGARARLHARLRTDAALAPLVAEREALAAALAAGTLGVAHLLARRPA